MYVAIKIKVLLSQTYEKIERGHFYEYLLRSVVFIVIYPLNAIVQSTKIIISDKKCTLRINFFCV